MKSNTYIRRTKRLLAGFFTAAALALACAITASANAAQHTDTAAHYRSVPVTVDQRSTEARAYIIENGVTYMPLRALAELLLPDADVYWDSKTSRAVVETEDLSLSAKPGDMYITANERYFALSGLYPAVNVLLDGTTYVPLRSAVRAMGGEIHWNAQHSRVEILRGDGVVEHGDTYYDEDAVHWLSRIIYAESGDQVMRGQVAVGNVVMNRVKSSDFPNTIYSVIFDRKYGVQFTPTANGAINKTPSEESRIAAKLVLDGCSVSDDALYFLDPRISSSFWVPQNRDFLFTIGCHDFYE